MIRFSTNFPPILNAISTSINNVVSVTGVGRLAMIPFVMTSLAYFQHNILDLENQPITVNKVDSEYDFIIIGGGSAGSIVANRLTEIKNWKILLVEAGGYENIITDVPIFSVYLHRTPLDWGYRTQPQKSACQAMNDQRCNWVRGKILGGSSVLNTMLYVRGNKRDFDRWRDLGNEGWGYEDVLPYFRKSEDQRNPNYIQNKRYHGTGGYQTVQNNPYNTPIGLAFLEAGQEMGYQIRDYNGEQQSGISLFQFTMRKGTRCSTAKAFLRPIRLRPNLHISIFTHATRLLINSTTRKTYGVEIFKNGRYQNVLAKKEVILSAGAINSPQLLMLSGIGSKQHLKDVGIPVIHDLPGVGKNVQDHIAAGAITFLIDYPAGITNKRIINLNSILEYAFNGSGPLTSSIGLEAVAFVSTKYANHSEDWPDIEMMLLSASTNIDNGQQIRRAHGLSNYFYNEVFASINSRDVFSVFPMILRPKSTGEIKLHSKSPFRHPLIYHNYLTDPHDVAVLREGVKIALKLGETNTMKKFGSKFHSTPYPNCKHLPLFTDEYWDCAIRQYTLSIYHYSCSAKMGPRSDPLAVVDPQLRVYGVSGLRIIDASIMPYVTSGNINAPVIMIGEKGADLVKEFWLKQPIQLNTKNFNQTIELNPLKYNVRLNERTN